MAKKAFRKGEIGRLNCLSDGTGAYPLPVKVNLLNGIESEPFLPGKVRNLCGPRIQAMSAAEVRADGHIPHADSFYQYIEEYTS